MPPHLPKGQRLCTPTLSQKTFYFKSSDFFSLKLSILNQKRQEAKQPAQVSHEAQKKKKKFLQIISVSEFKSCGRALLTLQLQLHRGLSGLKAGCQGAGLIFLHKSFICQSTQFLTRNRPSLLPNTNEEASRHMWVVASLEASQRLHILSGTEVPDELGLGHTKPAIVRS